jgi:hypothetical protein
MINLQTILRGLAWLAVCGMCLPFSVALGTEASSTTQTAGDASRPAPLIRDIALTPGGLLVGQVLDESMKPVRGTPVAIQVEGKTAASTVTDANGVFAVAGLRGGVHQVATGDSIENYRFWAPGTAPPQAAANLRFVPGQARIVRGQWAPPPGTIVETAKAWATNPWVIGGVVATAIAVPVILNNIDDDDEGS